MPTTSIDPYSSEHTPRMSTGRTYSPRNSLPGSPLKQQLFSPEVRRPRSPRDSRTLDQAHRWTVLTREAEADEVSILSITSEERGYFASLVPDAVDRRGSGFSDGVIVEEEDFERTEVDSTEEFSEVEFEGRGEPVGEESVVPAHPPFTLTQPTENTAYSL
jgi:hypothetical protein